MLKSVLVTTAIVLAVMFLVPRIKPLDDLINS